MSKPRAYVMVAIDANTVTVGAREVKNRFSAELGHRGLGQEVQVIETGSFGPADAGVMAVVQPDGVVYGHLTPEDVAEIVEEHFVKGRPCLKFVLAGERPLPASTATDSRQVQHHGRIVLENCGRIDPLRFDEFEKVMRQAIFISATPSTYEAEHAGQVVEQVVRPTGLIDPVVEVRPATHQVDDLMSEANERIKVGERVLVTTLTKRMAEQLTEYFAEHGIKVRYLHSDIETVERVEIIRDLRLGVFDVLVGINLLREGLDIPEVSLVAILDADKEGFLRSERSLIQTMGRAARHLNGKALLYADRITDSMRRAIDETERRRHKQQAYNEEHGITPQGVIKRIKDIIDGPYDMDAERAQLKAAQTQAKYFAMSEKDVSKEIARLEKEMLQAAKNLEFERAADLRDQLKKLRESVFLSPL